MGVWERLVQECETDSLTAQTLIDTRIAVPGVIPEANERNAILQWCRNRMHRKQSSVFNVQGVEYDYDDIIFGYICMYEKHFPEYKELYTAPTIDLNLRRFPTVFTPAMLEKSPLDINFPIAHFSTNQVLQTMVWLTWVCMFPQKRPPNWMADVTKVIRMLCCRVRVLVSFDVPQTCVADNHLAQVVVTNSNSHLLRDADMDSDNEDNTPRTKKEEAKKSELQKVRTNPYFLREGRILSCYLEYMVSHVEDIVAKVPFNTDMERDIEDTVRVWRGFFLENAMRRQFGMLREAYLAYESNRYITAWDTMLFKLHFPMLQGHANDARTVFTNKDAECACPVMSSKSVVNSMTKFGAEGITTIYKSNVRWFTDFMLESSCFTKNQSRLADVLHRNFYTDPNFRQVADGLDFNFTFVPMINAVLFVSENKTALFPSLTHLWAYVLRSKRVGRILCKMKDGHQTGKMIHTNFVSLKPRALEDVVSQEEDELKKRLRLAVKVSEAVRQLDA